jgi:hypothetical protein
MIHGPCGLINPACPCMDEITKKCSKEFLKEFREETDLNVNGYSLHRRRNNGSYCYKEVNGQKVKVDMF